MTDTTDSTIIVHSRAEVDQIVSNERGDYKIRNFDINYDAPQDEAALYRAVGEWVASMRKEYGFRFSVDNVTGNTFRVSVVYQVRPPRDGQDVAALSVVPDAA